MVNLISNKKATFNYEVLDRFEAGIELTGSEVKSLREGQASFEGSFISVLHGEAILHKLYISPHQKKNLEVQGREIDEYRNRKILMHKKEIEKLLHAGHGNRMTVIPLRFYMKGRKIKLEIALAQGKKKFDKRQSLKKRDDERRVARGE